MLKKLKLSRLFAGFPAINKSTPAFLFSNGVSRLVGSSLLTCTLLQADFTTTREEKSQKVSWDSNVIELKSPAVTALLTVIRNKETSDKEFAAHANRLLRLLSEEALAHLPSMTEKVIQTPCGPYKGLVYPQLSTYCAVSIMRSGDILLEQLRKCAPEMSVGKILLQRDEHDPEKRPKLYYSKLPPDINKKSVILVDPMLGTGGSSIAAINVLVKAGCDEKNILFVNVVACPEGIEALHKAYPHVKILTCAIDPKLNKDKFIVPGLGDFGDRYYSTH